MVPATITSFLPDGKFFSTSTPLLYSMPEDINVDHVDLMIVPVQSFSSELPPSAKPEGKDFRPPELSRLEVNEAPLVSVALD